MGFTTVLAPAENPISLNEAKDHLRVDSTADDSLINGLISAGTAYFQNTYGIALVSGTYQHTRNTLANEMELPLSPVQSINSVVLTDKDDVETTVGSDVYLLDTSHEPNRVRLRIDKSWPTLDLRVTGGVAIEFVAGYGDPEDVPEDLKSAHKLFVSNFYENREPVVVGTIASRVPFSIDALLSPRKVHLKDEE